MNNNYDKGRKKLSMCEGKLKEFDEVQYEEKHSNTT